MVDGIRGVWEGIFTQMIAGIRIENMGESAFQITVPIPEDKIQFGEGQGANKPKLDMLEREDGKLIYRLICTVDRGAGHIIVENHLGDQPMMTSHYRIHQDPLFVEAWNITWAGDRIAGKILGHTLLKLLNTIIENQKQVFL